MDGLLLDTEDKYSLCTNTILKKYGKPPLPWKIKAQMQGRPGPQSGGMIYCAFACRSTHDCYCHTMLANLSFARVTKLYERLTFGLSNLPRLGSAPNNPRRILRRTTRSPIRSLPLLSTSPRRSQTSRRPLPRHCLDWCA